jgi:ferredoxin-type protein NapG
MDACPSGSIQLAGPDQEAALGTPFVDASQVGCTLCLECTLTCPSGALLPLEKKENVRMGIAIVDERTCVSHNGTGVCGACHTACPFRNQAITQGLRNAPTVNEEFCVGCGLCEEACILKGTKAIRVESGRRKA